MHNKNKCFMALAIYSMLSVSHATASVITFDGLAGTDMLGTSHVNPGFATGFYAGVQATVNGFNSVAVTIWK